MPPRPVNDAQREVLDWLAAGGSQDPPRPEMKLSAASAAARGLVKVRPPGREVDGRAHGDGQVLRRARQVPG